MIMKKPMMALICAMMAFSACNKDDDNPITTEEETANPPKEEVMDLPEVLTGVFRDSEVQGLSFSTATQNGTTNDKGEFSFLEGETITFKVGELTLGSAVADTLITPISLAKAIDANATIASPLAQNIAALLQTLDSDNNHSNGIIIPQNIASAIGVQNIDFTQPIESTLADIVLSVAQNQGPALQIVYPGQAADNMAVALNIDYDAPPNFAISHLIPALKAFFQGYYKQHTPASAVYKNTFDVEGRLISTDIISRFSGNMLYSFRFSGYADDDQPAIGTYTSFNSNSRFGSSVLNASFEYELELSYDEDHRLKKFGELFNGQMANFTEFTSFDEDNRPLSYFRDLTQESFDKSFVISIDATYENGLINTSRRNFYRESIDGGNIINTTRELTYRYNDAKDLTNIDFTRVFEDTFTQDGIVTNTIDQGTHKEIFNYDNDQKLTSYESTEQGTTGAGEAYTSEWTRAYDANELLDSYTFSSTLNRESFVDYEAGILLSSQDFFNGQLTFEVSYASDGSSTFTNYFYNENNDLIRTELFERDANFRTIKQTNVYYDNGVISFIDELFYDENGNIGSIIYKDADGTVVQTNNYTYNASGQIISVEGLFADGSLWFTEEWEYNSDGLLTTINVFRADGTLETIYRYENGELATGEFYDEDGNLIETVDYTTSGKSKLNTNKRERNRKHLQSRITREQVRTTSTSSYDDENRWINKK
jgi:hypothetical protein